MSTYKNKLVILAAFAAALCLALAVAFVPVSARADESNAVAAFKDFGATEAAQDTDKALGLTEGGVTVSSGTEQQGDSLFESYLTDASGTLDLEEGSYRVSFAVIKEDTTQITLGGNAVTLTGGNGKAVAAATVESDGSPVAFAVTGKLCAVIATAPEAEVLMAAEYSEGQVVSYGKLIADELENATGYYSSGEIKEAEIEYGDIAAAAGINENFNTTDVIGVIKGTQLTVRRYAITMPDDLVYFVNAGSANVDNKFATGEGADPFYEYNDTVFKYYPDLLNKGTPDFGRYPTDSICSGFNEASFPYSSIVWNEKGKLELGYKLNNLTAGENYRVFIGALSHWHPRTVQIRFNGAVVGKDTLRIDSSRCMTVYENVTCDGSGNLDINLKGGSTNEPNIAFIAVQKMSTVYEAAPSALTSAPIIGMDDHTVTFTSGVQAGAKIQLYNAARPYNLVYEEMADGEKISDGRYTVDFGNPLTGVSQLCAVQISSGGVSEAMRISITDIKDFKAVLSPDGYTTGAVTVTVSANAKSGIASWSYRKGEFGEQVTYNLDLPYELKGEFTVTENDDYVVVITSGLGVTYSEVVTVGNIDADRPVINVTPSKNGWGKGSYNVNLSVSGVAPVVEYSLYRNGEQLARSAGAPNSISFAQEGEYVISVTNAAGVSALRSITVSSRPTTAKVTSRYANRTLTYTFADNSDYKVASISAYKVADSGVSRMTISSGNRLDVYDPGKYVVTVTTSGGTVEMFAINAAESDFNNNAAGPSKGVTLGVGLGVGLGGALVAGAAVAAAFIILKKKKA